MMTAKKMANGSAKDTKWSEPNHDDTTSESNLVTAEERSQQIDLYLKKEGHLYKQYMKKTMRLLLVGAGESGKSTIVKQMKILHKGGYTDEERRTFIHVIHSNIRESIVTLIYALSNLKPPESLADPSLHECVEYIRTKATATHFEFTDEFFDIVQRLWEDEGVQKCFLRANEFQLIDSAQYFLDKIDDIREPNFLPNDQDIVRTRQKTTGVLETHFIVKNINFHMLDVGGQRDERKKWLQCFSDVTALIFVVACSGFDTVLREDSSQNRLQESLDLYDSLWNNRFLQDTSVIIFLNKQDILAIKVASGRTSLETYFPDYKDYIASETVDPVDPGFFCCVSEARKDKQRRKESAFPALDIAESRELFKAKCFIRDRFQAKSASKSSQSSFVRRCYPHYTCAIDTENVRHVFNSTKDMIQRMHLDKIGVLRY